MGNCLAAAAQEEARAAAKQDAAPSQKYKINATAAVDQKCMLGNKTPPLHEHYEIGSLLGTGQFGTTRVAINKQTGQKLACKSISKAKLPTPSHVADVRREIQIMQYLSGHPNVVTFHGVYEDKQYIHIIMELCEGGDLFDKIFAKGHYTEQDAARIIRTIMTAVKACHDRKVMHRDLKPENFLLSDKSEEAQLKATDFGTSIVFEEGQVFTEAVGTPLYVAPEVLHKRYTKSADIWSCGVILYILLCGEPPYPGESTREVMESIRSCQGVEFSSHYWNGISAAAKDIVTRMLDRDPVKRATVEEVLGHEWVREGGVAADVHIDLEVLGRIKKFAAMNRLKKEALVFLAHTMPQDDIQELRKVFESMDKDGSGIVTAAQLREGLHLKSSAMGQSELERILAAADVHEHGGGIDYEEFLAATMNLSHMQQQEKYLHEAFDHFDVDHSGFITEDELEAALKEHCPTKAQLAKHIKSIMLEVDTNHDGVIDFQEFCHMMSATAAPAAAGGAAPSRVKRAKTARKGQLLPDDDDGDAALLQQLSTPSPPDAGLGEKKKEGKGVQRAKTMSLGQLARSKTARKGHLDVSGLLAASQGNLVGFGK